MVTHGIITVGGLVIDNAAAEILTVVGAAGLGYVAIKAIEKTLDKKNLNISHGNTSISLSDFAEKHGHKYDTSVKA